MDVPESAVVPLTTSEVARSRATNLTGGRVGITALIGAVGVSDG